MSVLRTITAANGRPRRRALLSFRRRFAETLLDGRKRHEFHRGSGPELTGIEKHPDLSGITADHLGDSLAAVALQVDAVHRLAEPVPLAAPGLDRPPRS